MSGIKSMQIPSEWARANELQKNLGLSYNELKKAAQPGGILDREAVSYTHLTLPTILLV